MSKKFKDKLRAERTAKRRTLDELAEAIGSSKAYVWQLENKPNAKPSAELLLKIANYFGVSPDYFLDDEVETVEELTEKQGDDTFFRKFQRLSDQDRKTIENIMRNMDVKD